jgi:hypothetical protein
MRRRFRAGGEPVKTGRKTAARKPAVRRGFATDQETEFARIIHERDQALEQLSEALEQQTATSEVLKVISSSPGDLQPVFDAMLSNAARLCEARFGNLYLYQDGALHTVASHNVPPAFAAARRRGPWHPKPNGAAGKVIRTKQTVHVIDVADTPLYRERVRDVVDAVELGGVRTLVMVPMPAPAGLLQQSRRFRSPTSQRRNLIPTAIQQLSQPSKPEVFARRSVCRCLKRMLLLE